MKTIIFTLAAMAIACGNMQAPAEPVPGRPMALPALRKWSAAECDGYAVTQSRAYCTFHGCDGVSFDQAVYEDEKAFCEANHQWGPFASEGEAFAFASTLDSLEICKDRVIAGDGSAVVSVAGDNRAPYLVFCRM